MKEYELQITKTVKVSEAQMREYLEKTGMTLYELPDGFAPRYILLGKSSFVIYPSELKMS